MREVDGFGEKEGERLKGENDRRKDRFEWVWRQWRSCLLAINGDLTCSISIEAAKTCNLFLTTDQENSSKGPSTNNRLGRVGKKYSKTA